MSVMEHSEHIAHAEHGHGHGGESKLGTYVGITMAILGVLLAFCAAKVGTERTELISAMLEQSTAHAKYLSQDVKHRTAAVTLQQLHATAFATGTPNLNKADVLSLAKTVQRYVEEGHLAKEWSESFEPTVKEHIEAQEGYELAQVLTEIAIVICSVALLMRRKLPWMLSIALGVTAIALTAKTFVHSHSAVELSEAKTAELYKTYREARTKNKASNDEGALIESITKWAEQS